MNTQNHVLIIIGPTASGKTDLALKIGESLPIEIINADVGQFYTPCSIGTAKPAWKNLSVPHHLFDILDSPQDLNVAEYRKTVIEKVDEISKRGKLPVIVGGSLFYVKSLFFPPQEFLQEIMVNGYEGVLTADLWNQLHEVDSQRADKLHHNDRYRIARALNLWDATNVKPSEYEPLFNAPFNALIVVVKPKRESLFDTINKRTNRMIGENPLVGWLDEARRLLGTPWESFLNQKKLVGYDTIFAWLRSGENAADLPSLVETIQNETRQYAKRQMTFYGSFKKALREPAVVKTKQCSVREIVVINAEVTKRLIHDVAARFAVIRQNKN